MVSKGVEISNNNIEDEFIEVDLPTIGSMHKIDVEEEEIWLLQCPKGVKLSELKEEQIKVPGRTTIKEHIETVVTEFPSGFRQEAFAYCRPKHKYAVKLLPVRGSIIVRNCLQFQTDLAKNIGLKNEEVNNEEDTSSQNYVRSLADPSTLPIRHPLFGRGFEESLKTIKPLVQKRLLEVDLRSKNLLPTNDKRVSVKRKCEQIRSTEIENRLKANKFEGEIKEEPLSDSDTEIVPEKRKRRKN